MPSKGKKPSNSSAMKHYQESERIAAEKWSWWYDGRGKPYLKISEEEWQQWKDKSRLLHCIFCGWHGGVLTAQAYRGCPRCSDYKGLEPCLPQSCEDED